jgi:hypothetical protein
MNRDAVEGTSSTWIAAIVGGGIGGFAAFVLFLTTGNWLWFLLFPPAVAFAWWKAARPAGTSPEPGSEA